MKGGRDFLSVLGLVALRLRGLQASGVSKTKCCPTPVLNVCLPRLLCMAKNDT